jgi:hypothetical protein
MFGEGGWPVPELADSDSSLDSYFDQINYQPSPEAQAAQAQPYIRDRPTDDTLSNHSDERLFPTDSEPSPHLFPNTPPPSPTISETHSNRCCCSNCCGPLLTYSPCCNSPVAHSCRYPRVRERVRMQPLPPPANTLYNLLCIEILPKVAFTNIQDNLLNRDLRRLARASPITLTHLSSTRLWTRDSYQQHLSVEPAPVFNTIFNQLFVPVPNSPFLPFDSDTL